MSKVFRVVLRQKVTSEVVLLIRAEDEADVREDTQLLEDAADLGWEDVQEIDPHVHAVAEITVVGDQPVDFDLTC